MFSTSALQLSEGETMKIKTALVKFVLRFIADSKREHTGAFAAQTAFFLIMSFIPMYFLVLMAIGLLGLGAGGFHNVITEIDVGSELPSYYKLFSDRSLVAIVGTLILAAWSAGKSFKSLTEGLHSVLHISDSRNYILSRIRGFVCSLAFAVVVGALYLFGVFSEYLYTQLLKFEFQYVSNVSWIFGFNEILTFVCIFAIFSFVYRFVPDWSVYSKFGRKRIEQKYIFAGAFVSTLVICIYTLLFSYYISQHSNISDIHGSLSTLVCVMLWLYASMYILISGFRLSNYLSLRALSAKNNTPAA